MVVEEQEEKVGVEVEVQSRGDEHGAVCLL